MGEVCLCDTDRYGIGIDSTKKEAEIVAVGEKIIKSVLIVLDPTTEIQEIMRNG